MRHFFIDSTDISGNRCVISGQDARHIQTVLRKKTGDRIGLFDGNGYEYLARIEDVSSGRVQVVIDDRLPSAAESPVDIAVAQALLKDGKMDDLVRQVTELGITRWYPFTSSRCVPRPDPKRMEMRRQRWEKIAKEALKQCRRGRLPEIGSTLTFEQILKRGQEFDLSVVYWEGESTPVRSMLPPNDGRIRTILVLLGPEGGFSREEIQMALANGFLTATLGPRILRAETATVAACSLIQYLYGDLGGGPYSKSG
ncbi:MAG: 16S rRNA (uracil(1498)-N(3))-methyltransferase [Desulfobacterales bacterium]|nr:16S rRNA (uracil(1498)-N(3))-methyltransferase [Desulfobacterales bacterium]MDD4072637.1 16S rRNA (uracil(1498)-N(3))-methyltransferase [Desulfobacterales bacterium]MDD4391467.1 16S rRNA (uracil(1498)-N(3))-methyltransferase [Desulfobacterales bacterium]